jgi:nucleoside-diphosphate-sugar epimerase
VVNYNTMTANPSRGARPLRVLLTGATGILGTETLQSLRAIPGLRVTAVSARGSKDDVLAWPMGRSPAPTELACSWDVVIHAAASTRWNMSANEAEQMNLASTAALQEIVNPETHVVHISTAFVEGRCGSTQSADLADYRNTYEWSKAGAERMVTEKFPSVTIIRPPLIIGRRSDGHVARFTGIYTLLRAVIAGLAPLVVADPHAHVELVPVDDLTQQILSIALGSRPEGARVVIFGRGTKALTVGDVCLIVRRSINGWRAERDASILNQPPIVTPRRWERLLLPLAREHLSARHLHVIDALSYFIPYLSMEATLRPTVVVDDVTIPLQRSIRFWADRNPRAALREPTPWITKRSK